MAEKRDIQADKAVVALKQELAEIEEYERKRAIVCDRLREQCDEAQAACAAMRSALEEIVSILPTFEDERLDWVEMMVYRSQLDAAKQALSSSAGRDMLERLQRAEGLLRQFKEIDCLPLCDEMLLTNQHCKMRGGMCAKHALYKAIDAFLAREEAPR